MKSILLALMFVLSTPAWAQDTDPCLDTLEQKFMSDSQNQEWGFERIIAITKDAAIDDLDNALWDMNDEDTLEKAKQAALEDGKLFYALGWTAPSNEGYNVIIADKATCTVLYDIGIWSQE